MYGALQAGATGFLLKDVTPERLVWAVRQVVEGDTLLAPSITRRLVERFARPSAPRRLPEQGLSELTARETEVLKLMGREMSNREIAASLLLSEATVKTHVAHILFKPELRDRVQAVVAAYESGLVSGGGGMEEHGDR